MIVKINKLYKKNKEKIKINQHKKYRNNNSNNNQINLIFHFVKYF